MVETWKKLAYEDLVITKALLAAKGDIVYASVAGVPAALAIGADGHVLTVATDVPNWEAGGAGGATIASGTYTGDNTTSRQITTGFKCSMVVLYGDYIGGDLLVVILATIKAIVTHDMDVVGQAPYLHATDGFVVGVSYANRFNTNGETYYYWAASE